MNFSHLFKPEPLLEESITLAKEVMVSGCLFRYDYVDPNDSVVSLLEQEFAEKLGCKYVLAVNSCGSAIQLALLSAGAKPGDSVLVPGFTFTAVISAVVNCGCIPVLIDIEDDYCISISDLRKKYNPSIKILLLSYMRGRVARLDDIFDFCSSHNVIVVEDCAHSLGSFWKGRQTGVFGSVSCFSFHDKLLSSGEGGILVTNDEDIIMKSIVMSGSYENLWKRHIKHPKLDNIYQGEIPQFSMRMNAVTAAILKPQISYIDKYIAEYRSRCKLLKSKLSKSNNIRFPENDINAELVDNTIQFEFTDLTNIQIDQIVSSICNAGIPLARFGLNNRNDRCVWNWNYLDEKIQKSVPHCFEILENTCDLRIRRTMTDDDIANIANTVLGCIISAIK
jgi:perosamine synthetase